MFRTCRGGTEERERRCEEEGGGQRNSGMHRLSSLLWPPLSPPPPPSPPPFLSQETPSGFEWKPDLSSLVGMLRWDVPASLSSSLYSPFIPKHKYYLPHAFVCLSLRLFLSNSLRFCISFCQCSPPHPTSVLTSPVDHYRANDVINGSLVIVIDSWHCGRGWGHVGGSAPSLLGNFLI